MLLVLSCFSYVTDEQCQHGKAQSDIHVRACLPNPGDDGGVLRMAGTFADVMVACAMPACEPMLPRLIATVHRFLQIPVCLNRT